MGWSREQAQALGKKGGQRTMERHGISHMQALGKKGWAAMVAKHGRAALVANGKKGFQATANRYFGGDTAALVRWLADAGLAAIDPMPGNGVWQRRQPWPERTAARDPKEDEV